MISLTLFSFDENEVKVEDVVLVMHMNETSFQLEVLKDSIEDLQKDNSDRTQIYEVDAPLWFKK